MSASVSSLSPPFGCVTCAVHIPLSSRDTTEVSRIVHCGQRLPAQAHRGPRAIARQGSHGQRSHRAHGTVRGGWAGPGECAPKLTARSSPLPHCPGNMAIGLQGGRPASGARCTLPLGRGVEPSAGCWSCAAPSHELCSRPHPAPAPPARCDRLVLRGSFAPTVLSPTSPSGRVCLADAERLLAIHCAVLTGATSLTPNLSVLSFRAAALSPCSHPDRHLQNCASSPFFFAEEPRSRRTCAQTRLVSTWPVFLT